MAHELADFRALFPELDPVSDTVVTAYLDRAESKLYEDAWGTCYDDAVLLYAAHSIMLSQYRAAAVKTVNGSTVIQEGAGAITSASVGGMSVGYASPNYATQGTKSEVWLAQTPYGKEFLALQSQCLVGARLAGNVRNEFRPTSN